MFQCCWFLYVLSNRQFIGDILFFFYKQKSAYERRISDWSSDVCSSDLSLRVVADSAHHMLHILARFRERYPGIAMVVSAGNSEEVIAQLYDYEAEVGILGEVPESRDFVVIKLSSTPLIAFTSRAHALSRRRSITLAELAAQLLVDRKRG